MNKNVKIIVIIIFVIALMLLNYFIGYKKAYDEFEYGLSQSNSDPNTFYATIEEINEYNGITTLLVDGLDINDINFRNEFSFKVVEETKIEWRNTEKNISDLAVGDTISITFEGEIMETYPAKISDVVKIQILNDN